MRGSRESKLIIVCFLLCFFLIKSDIIVKAEETLGTACNDIEIQSIEEDDKDTVECIMASWEDVKNILSSVIVEMLGAFLGFLSAIALTNRSNRKQMKELDASLLDELRKICKELEERLEDKESEDYFRYQTPIWEISLQSGTLALVINNKVYNKYIQIYSKIQYAQDLESEYVHAKLNEKVDEKKGEKECFVNRYIRTIDLARKREAKDIYEYIRKMH